MLPELHPQWRSLDFAALFERGAVFVNTDAQNSILDPDGVLSHEEIWRGAREQGGSLHNIIRLAVACRGREMPFLWLRYDRFIGERQPVTAMDTAQYEFWNNEYDGDDAQKAWEADLVPEVKAIMALDDITLVYPAWSIFTGTPIERWLAQWGARTLLISGYHTDWCVEMAVRCARDMGFMPVVIGDACGTTEPLHDQTLAQINDCYAPVISTSTAIEALNRT